MIADLIELAKGFTRLVYRMIAGTLNNSGWRFYKNSQRRVGFGELINLSGDCGQSGQTTFGPTLRRRMAPMTGGFTAR
jgi:hypothetical protein